MPHKKRNRYTYLNISELPPEAQTALQHFRAAFNVNNSFDIVHVRRDAIFIQLYGTLNAYSVARLINHADGLGLYIEIAAVAPMYSNLRIFFSKWIRENELPRHEKHSQKPYTPKKDDCRVRVRRGQFTRTLENQRKKQS